MTNAERYVNILRDLSTPYFGVSNGKLFECSPTGEHCKGCEFNNRTNCNAQRIEWLIAENFETPEKEDFNVLFNVRHGAIHKVNANMPDTIIKKYICNGEEITEIYKSDN